jgi:hypothetical protein
MKKSGGIQTAKGLLNFTLEMVREPCHSLEERDENIRVDGDGLASKTILNVVSFLSQIYELRCLSQVRGVWRSTTLKGLIQQVSNGAGTSRGILHE